MSQSAKNLRENQINKIKPSTFKYLILKPAIFGSFIPIVTLLNAFVGLVLPGLMNTQIFGEYALVVTLFNYGLIFDLGISQIIDRRIPMHVGRNRLDLAKIEGDKLIWLRLYIGVAAFIVAAGALIAINFYGKLSFNLTAGILATFAGLADMIALGPVCLFRARSARSDYALGTSVLLLGLVIARLGGLIAGGLVGCFAALAVWYVVFAIMFNKNAELNTQSMPDKIEAWAIIKFGIPFFITSFIWAFYVTGNRWIASFLIDPKQFGLFAFSANIFSLLVGAIGGFSAFYYPRIAEIISKSSNFAVSDRLVRDFCRLVGVVTVIIAIGIILSSFLVKLIYPQYADGISTARIILVAVPPMVLASWLMPISLSGGGRPLFDGLLVYPTATAILAVGIVVLYRVAGAQGAAGASTISALPLVGMQLGLLCHSKIIRGKHAWIIMAWTMLVSIFLGILIWWMSI